MKISKIIIAKAPVITAFATALFLGLSTFAAADSKPVESDQTTATQVEQQQESSVRDLLHEINSPSAPLPVVTRPKGAEPHQRFGYDKPFTTSEKNPSHKIFQYLPDSSRSKGTESILAELSSEVAGKVFYELKEEGQKHLSSRVAVVAAVPLADLKRETEFGRIVAEYYLTDLADRGIKVTELRMGSDINILPQTGEFILSRNIGEIANNTPSLDYVVVTTFTNTRKTLILQGRLVSLKSGEVKTSWRYNLPLTRELLGLFYSADQQPFTIAVKGVGQ